MSVAGTYDCFMKTPMGDQAGIFVVQPSADGTNFAGTMTGAAGSMETEDGTISGNTLTWKMRMTMPMPMELDCEVTIDGDELSGTIKAGMFGTMALSGKRQA